MCVYVYVTVSVCVCVCVCVCQCLNFTIPVKYSRQHIRNRHRARRSGDFKHFAEVGQEQTEKVNHTHHDHGRNPIGAGSNCAWERRGGRGIDGDGMVGIT
jgi:hypothetical protein